MAEPTGFRKAIEVVVRGTKFENHWQLNKPAKIGWLNFFVGTTGLYRVRNTCAYLGYDGLIVCDGSFLDSFLERRNVPVTRKFHPSNPSTQAAIVANIEKDQQAFVVWVLAHELGHLIRGDGAPHFFDSSIEAQTANDALAREKERNADDFAASLLEADPDLSITVESLMIDLINSEIRTAIGDPGVACVGICFDYTNRRAMQYAEKGTHPEYVLRGVRMLQLLCAARNDEGLCNMVSDFAKTLSPKNQTAPR